METGNDTGKISDHLANERTYLAWMRTGISTMGFGVVIAKLRYIFPPNALTPPSVGFIHASNIGLIFTVIGLLTVALSAYRYVTIQEQIREDRYRASKALVLAFSAVVAVLGMLIVWYLMQGVAGPR